VATVDLQKRCGMKVVTLFTGIGGMDLG